MHVGVAMDRLLVWFTCLAAAGRTGTAAAVAVAWGWLYFAEPEAAFRAASWSTSVSTSELDKCT